MGESFNAVSALEAPLSFVDERVVFIPKHRRLEVQNRHFKLICALEGEADIEIDGAPLGRFRRGDVLIVPRACRQTYIPATRDELRLHVLRIYFELGDGEGERGASAPALPEQSLGRFLRENFTAACIHPPGESSRIHEYVRGIQSECEAKGVAHRFALQAYVRLMITELARSRAAAPAVAVSSAETSAPFGSWTMEHVKQYLFEHYARALSLDEIAWEVRLSNEHLCRRFKEHTGQTVFSYLRQLRIAAAKSYLISSKLSVTEIARRTGFSSVTLFCRRFKQAVGVAPIDFRRRGVAGISFEATSLQPADKQA